MAFDDAGDDCEANSRSLELGIAVEALEWPKQLLCVRRVEAYAVVRHQIYRSPGLGSLPQLNHGAGLLLSEFPGVAQEVLQNNAQKSGISLGLRVWRGDEAHLARRLVSAQLADDRVR
jgi:hypothetical protein